MTSDHPWEKIFSSDGRIFNEVLPLFHEAAHIFTKNRIHSILDLGCGNGRHVVAFRRLGFNATGFDISESGLRLTSEWLSEDRLAASLVLGDSRTGLPFSSASFDGLISTQVIHHATITEIQMTISEIYRVLENNGLALITVAGKRHEDWLYKEIEPGTYIPLDGPEKGLPHHIFSEQELARECKAFNVMEISQRDHGRVLAVWLRKTGI